MHGPQIQNCESVTTKKYTHTTASNIVDCITPSPGEIWLYTILKLDAQHIGK